MIIITYTIPMKQNSPSLVQVDGNILIKSLALDPKVYVIGRSNEADLVLDGKAVSRKHASVRFEDNSYVLEDLKSTNGTFVNGEKIESRKLNHGDEITIGDFTVIFNDGRGIGGIIEETKVEKVGEETKGLKAGHKSLAKRLRGREKAELNRLTSDYERSRKKLKHEANQDRLTGVFNRRYFDREFSERIRDCRTSATSLSLIFIDLDHFKKVNDTFGHDKGDEALKAVADLIKATCRQDDIVARYGGEEFVVIFSKMSTKNAMTAAESIRRIVEEKSEDFAGVKITVSIGVATFPDHAKNCQGLIRKADAAVYRAKSSGRNQVVISNA